MNPFKIGDKARILERLISFHGDVLEIDTIVEIWAIQNNHCRITGPGKAGYYKHLDIKIHGIHHRIMEKVNDG